MAYIRSKKIRRSTKRPSHPGDPDEYTYYQIVEGYRDEDGKVRQRVLAHLGRESDPEAVIARLEKWAGWHREHAADLRYAAEKMRERSFENLRNLPFEERMRKRFKRARYGRGAWLLPRDGTSVPEETPYPTTFAPKGWFYFRGDTPEDAEREAAEDIAKAQELSERAAHIRSVVTKKVGARRKS